MWIASNVPDMRKERESLRGKIAVVPTMGALHEGHLALMRHARTIADRVIVTIFVNPTQFGPNEDFNRYPRPFDTDVDLVERTGVDGVFSPTVDAMYPPDTPACEINVPSVAAELEGAIRPGHFAGVCRIVAKLFNIIQPDSAVFGRKDYQQWRVIEAMTRDLMMPIDIVPHPTVRAPDGLALSSRNQYLRDGDRNKALGLVKALREAKLLVESAGETDPRIIENAMRTAMQAHHVEVDYAAVRHPVTLAHLDSVDPALTGGVVALVAGKVGSVRLIDNMVLGETIGRGA